MFFSKTNGQCGHATLLYREIDSCPSVLAIQSVVTVTANYEFSRSNDLGSIKSVFGWQIHIISHQSNGDVEKDR